MTTDNDRLRAEQWMRHAIELSARCQPSPGAYSVGAVIVGADGTELAAGYSREEHPREHAEEAALRKVPTDDPRLKTAVLYSTLEPCTQRSADRTPCTYRVMEAGIPHVVIAWREPAGFVEDCTGVEELRAAGVTVTELPELADQVRAVNEHLPHLGETR
ncbi:deaminase [Streptomyces boncukensis]|uniref:dCMP deaminase n=1 Tax=Streptomyces boncukensis TaxID=2711219 RepID=A0A6G4WPI0_9ACTN|nr:deaminase [Streptomyces boncukensis]NGO66998.1 dCMP deaminase [Streptomyces boncukensis]